MKKSCAAGLPLQLLQLWRERATNVSGHSLPCGHYIAEEAPESLIGEALSFFQTVQKEQP